jgi:hypothetical protein
MKHKRFAIVGGVALVLLVFFTFVNHVPVEQLYTKTIDSNPQKFHLFVTSNSISYWITQDPRASDEWLFRSGGGLLPNNALEPTATAPSVLTNK